MLGSDHLNCAVVTRVTCSIGAFDECTVWLLAFWMTWFGFVNFCTRDVESKDGKYRMKYTK